MICFIRYILLIFIYLFVGGLLIRIYNITEEDYREHFEQLENAKLNCQAVYDGSPEAKKFKVWQLNTARIQRELEDSDEICSSLRRFFVFEETPLSVEERQFPLAFGFLVHVDIIQVLTTLSVLYQPQNQYCITIDNRAVLKFKNVLMKLPRCFENVRVQIGDMSFPQLFKMGVLNNVYQCVTDLTTSGSHWKYYQFVATHDFPLKTNLEMVRILKALNGSINTQILPYAEWRYGIRRSDSPPLPLYQGEMGIALPREAAEHIVMHPTSRKIDILLNYLNKTHAPFETFWSTVAANKRGLKTPGSFFGQDLLYLQEQVKEEYKFETQTIDHVGKTVIARLEISLVKEYCRENPMCYFEVEDVPMLLRRPELMAHKTFMSVQPAAYICLAKELRRRSHKPDEFDAISYSRMPTVEIYSGTPIERLSFPEWMATGRKNERL